MWINLALLQSKADHSKFYMTLFVCKMFFSTMISREGLGISWYNISTPVAGWAVPEDIVVIRNSLDLKPIEHWAENTGLWETILKCFTFCVKLFRKQIIMFQS